MNNCFNCGEPGTEFYGYVICEDCKTGLRLFSDKTINKYSTKDPEAYMDEIKFRIDFIDKDYIKKRIKLLHIKDRLEHF